MNKFAKILGCAVVFASLMTQVPAKADFYFTGNDRLVLQRYVVAPRVPRDVVFYTRGTVLPDRVVYQELPPDAVRHLAPPPQGGTYVSYGGNVYLIDRDRRVMDALELY